MRRHSIEPPASTLARGAARTCDIEEARRHLAECERKAAERLHRTAGRLEREAARMGPPLVRA